MTEPSKSLMAEMCKWCHELITRPWGVGNPYASIVDGQFSVLCVSNPNGHGHAPIVEAR